MPKDQWEDLLEEIHSRQVIPIIGPELVTVPDRTGNGRQPLYTVMASDLAKELDLPAMPDAALSLNRVACDHLLRQGERKKIYLKVAGLLARLEERGEPPSPALCDLASMTDFDLFITGTIDHLLAAAVEQERPGFRRLKPTDYIHGHVIASSCCNPVDVPEDLTPAVVYHLVGNRSTTPAFAVWEEDYLEFLHGLIRHEAQLPNLFRLLKNRYLLFLGVPFDHWIVRLFLFVAKGGRFTDHRKDDIVAYITDTSSHLEEPLVFFFDKVVGTVRIIRKDPSAFVSELAARWRKQYLNEAAGDTALTLMPDECPNGAVFISYAHEDRAAVNNLVCRLRSAHVPVWLDKERLKGGVDYQRELESSVKQACSFFLATISKATEGDTQRFVHREWQWAAQKHVDGRIFIIPVILDENTEPPKDPPQFAASQWMRAPGGKLSNADVNRIVSLVEEYRSKGQPRV